MALQKSLALAEIALSVPKQWAANAEAGAKISASAPPFTVPLGVAYTVGANIASTVGAGVAAAKIMGIGFRKGGATGTAAAAESPLALSGFQIGAGGKLLDAEGYAVAGVVYENEYVIPEWMRADPQVVRIEEFLEQKRLRGYLDGGPTSADVAPASVAATTGAGADQLLVQVLGRLDSRLQEVEQWQRELGVYLEVQPLGQTLDEREQTRKAAEIR
ncbi:hypothetical protein [Hymenobacter yonginensis]|uniref:Uncharacterized protein n=1 Tax=Hymenobacter yonginensis TaxID=748197 RepID=A0ABY7PV48_9BACT|nr:hypothetical protein [Hymenobacter yonginensis]WBO86739.1 hypothetical protein O9Z63_20880 [Hymenobacter yonginensis]